MENSDDITIRSSSGFKFPLNEYINESGSEKDALNEDDELDDGDHELDALLDQDLQTLSAAKVTTPDLDFEVESVARTEKPIGDGADEAEGDEAVVALIHEVHTEVRRRPHHRQDLDGAGVRGIGL